jgi:DNA polymerase
LPRAAQEARKHGIAPPKSFAKDSEEFEVWLKEHGEKFPWAKALGEYRSANRLSKTFQTLKERTDESGVFRYGLKYGGAHTLRDSGDAGFNVQNPPKESLFGCDLRGGMLTAPEGFILGIADESAIEPRVLSCLSGDEKLREMLAAGTDPYEAQARIAHGYTDTRPLKLVDPVRRQYMKVEVLACGYGAGEEKIQLIAKRQVGLELSLNEAKKIKEGFRKRRFIPEFWERLERDCRKSAPGNYEIDLPSGRTMTYRDVKSFGSISAVIPRLNQMMRVKLWGGTLTENVCQALARDIFMWHIMEIKKQLGFSALLRAHDELVVLLPIATSEEDFGNILKIMQTPPPWMPEFPAAAEGKLKKAYCKI